MEPSDPTLDILCDPQVKACFLQLLDSSLSAEEKYQKFVDFCAYRTPPGYSRTDNGVRQLLPRVAESIRRAVWRMQRSQHQDGGWGLQVEQSSFWQSAYAVLFLWAARAVNCHGPLPDIELMVQRSLTYLEMHPENWSTDTLLAVDGMPVQEVSLMVRCFYGAGRSFWRRESALRVYRSMDRLYRAQNADGGWDTNIWGYEVSTPTRMWSEVGATSAAVRALAEAGDERFHLTVEKGLRWLLNTQNPDGSWNDGSCAPDLADFQLSGSPSINKTCDALQGLLSAEALKFPPGSFQTSIDRAAGWLHRHEKITIDRQNHLTGWGWGYSATDYEHACLTLETLLRLPSEPLPRLASYAAWLMQGQRCQTDDPDDGGWALGHTARIGLALVSFYQRAVEEMGSGG